MLWFGASAKVRSLEDRLEILERRFKALELEWVDTYDKLRKALGRVVKSRAIMEAKEQEEEAVQPMVPTLTQGPHGLLSDRQKQIQQQILRRRAGGNSA